MSEQSRIYVCASVLFQMGASIRGAKLIQGSKLQDCDGCGNKIWVSPATFELKTENDGILACEICFKKMPKDYTVQDLTSMQKQELLRHIRKVG